VYENEDDEDSDFSWITPISYQHSSSSVPVRQCEPARIAAQDQWIDIFLPAVSCISNACKEGVLSMVKQTTDGYHEIQNDLKAARRQHRENVKETFSSYRQGYTKDPPKVQGGYQNVSQKGLAAGQATAERYAITAGRYTAAAEEFREDDLLCYHPGEWRPSGILFVPAEEVQQYQYDDVSAMTDDGSGATTKKCLGFCPVL